MVGIAPSVRVFVQLQKNLSRGVFFLGAAGIVLGLVAGIVTGPGKVSATGSYTAEYWNIDAEGSPAFPTGPADLTRVDSELVMDWGGDSPDPSINVDGFAARWTRTLNLDAGNYYFNVMSDDGVRVYVDGTNVIDAWYDQSGNVHLGNLALSAGSHQIKVEYYENTGGAFIDFTYGIVDGADAILGQEKYTTDNSENSNTNSMGFDEPRAIAVDGVGHRMFVADEENSRVLVFNLNTNNFLVENSADYVLGQPDLVSGDCNHDSAPTAATLCGPYGLAYDPTNNRLFVADSDNYRVLVYDVASITNGEDAVSVLGQPNFTSSDCCDVTANGVAFIESIAYDNANQRLFVGDGHRRVLVFDVSSITNNEDAVHVLGQEDFESEEQHCYYEPDVTADGFCNYATGLSYDASNNWLFVSDQGNYRVVVFDVTAITDGEDAVHVLGQPDLTTGNCCAVDESTIADARGLSYDPTGKMLYVGDAGFSGANRVLVYDLNTFTDGEDAVHVLGHEDFTSSNCNTPSGDPAADNLCGPYGVLYDTVTGLLYVADTFNNRVMMFDVDVIADGEDNYNFFGQPDVIYNAENGRWNPNPQGLDGPFSLAIDTDNHRLFVGDRWNYRVLVYNLDEDNQIVDTTADIVIGQPDMYTGGSCETDIKSVCETQGLAYDPVNERLFVSDRNNSRVLVFDVDPDTLGNEPDAINVLGQPDFDSFDCNNGGRSATSLCQPFHLAYDQSSGYLWVADKQNSRVMGYNVAPGTLADHMAATKLLGQSAFNAGTCDRGGATAANTLCQERGLAINSTTHELYISDGSSTQRNRVLVHDADPGTMTNGQDAAHVLGQVNFTDVDCNQDSDAGINTLCNPNGVSLDEAHDLLYVHDEYNHRIVVFDVASITDGEDGVKILGQVSPSGTECNWDSDSGPENYTFCTPISSTINQETGDLFVADTWNNRVLAYNYGTAASDTDADNDGITDATEAAAPNSGDANNDGTDDVDQDFVTSLIDPVTNEYAVLEAPDNCANDAVTISAESENAVADVAFNYPAGLMNFTLNCGLPGETVTVTMYYFGVSPTNLVARKYHENNNSYSTISGAVLSTLTIGGQSATKVVYQITDGGSMDQDETANGIIVDPAGLGLNVLGAPNTGLGGTENN